MPLTVTTLRPTPAHSAAPATHVAADHAPAAGRLPSRFWKRTFLAAPVAVGLALFTRLLGGMAVAIAPDFAPLQFPAIAVLTAASLNFPSRRELLEALYTDEVDTVCKAAETVDGETPGAVFVAWLHGCFAYFTAKRHVASELLEHSGSSNPVFDDSRARVLAAGRPLLVAAQQVREVRDDLTLEQVLGLVLAIATIRGDTRYLAPILQTALDGLRPPPDREPA